MADIHSWEYRDMKSIDIEHYKFERKLWDIVLREGRVSGTEEMVLNMFLKAMWYNLQNEILRK